MSKVILAGNGSSVLDHNLGSYIDSEFDLVYRMNRFKTKGFEEYVGSRVDGWFAAEYFAKTLIHPDEKIEGSLRWKDFKYVFLCMPKFKYSIESVRHLLNDEIQMLSYKYEDEINTVIDFSPKWPTTGLLSIQFLIEQYGKVYVHGFDGMSSKYEYIHYYDKGDTDRLTTKYNQPDRIDHDYSVEKKYLNILRDEGKVIDIV